MPRNESVIRAFTIIEYLSQADDWVGLRQVARDLGLNPSTALRFLNSLKQLGYVTQEPDAQRYQLTLKINSLGARVLDRIQLRVSALPFMEKLAKKTNETVHLGILEGSEIVYVEKVDSQQPMQMRSRIGSRAYVHSTALGKAISAFLPPEECEELLSVIDYFPLTSHTIRNRKAFLKEHGQIRMVGYAVDDQENEVGIRCLGAPVFDHSGKVVGALGISGWTITMTCERVVELATDLLDTCRLISASLGYHDLAKLSSDCKQSAI